MGAEAILDKIRKNAAEETALLRKQGDEKAAAAAEKIRSDAKAEADYILEDAKKRVADLERREKLMAGLEARKNTLASRRQVIDEAFESAGILLEKLFVDRWEALITRLILEAAETGEETLLVPEKDKEKYEKGLLKEINDSLKKSGRAGKLVLSDTPAKIQGGFILSGPNYDVNGSYEMLLSLVREESEQEIYQMLFPDQEGREA